MYGITVAALRLEIGVEKERDRLLWGSIRKEKGLRTLAFTGVRLNTCEHSKKGVPFTEQN